MLCGWKLWPRTLSGYSGERTLLCMQNKHTSPQYFYFASFLAEPRQEIAAYLSYIIMPTPCTSIKIQPFQPLDLANMVSCACLPFRSIGSRIPRPGTLTIFAEYAARTLIQRRTCSKCPGCGSLALCSEECAKQHQARGTCAFLQCRARMGRQNDYNDEAVMPLSFTSLPARTARTASDQQAPHTTGTDPTPHPTSPLQRDASATASCPAAAAVPAPSRSVSAQRMHKPVSAAQALAAEYRQCVESNPLLQRVAEVVMPRGAEREPESAAVMAAQQLLIAASGLLDARDLEEVLAAAGA